MNFRHFLTVMYTFNRGNLYKGDMNIVSGQKIVFPQMQRRRPLKKVVQRRVSMSVVKCPGATIRPQTETLGNLYFSRVNFHVVAYFKLKTTPLLNFPTAILRLVLLYFRSRYHFRMKLDLYEFKQFSMSNIQLKIIQRK